MTCTYLLKKGLRGGISYICKRFSKANNKHMNNYDLRKPSKYIMYFDANNLHEWAMSRYCPYGGFKVLQNVDKSDVNLISENSSIVYIFKVDFEYPDELHYLHKDYLLAPEKLAILDDMLSNYCKKIVDKYGIKVGDVKKLIPNLGNKSCLRSSLQKSSVVFVFRNKTDLNSQSFKIYTI